MLVQGLAQTPGWHDCPRSTTSDATASSRADVAAGKPQTHRSRAAGAPHPRAAAGAGEEDAGPGDRGSPETAALIRTRVVDTQRARYPRYGYPRYGYRAMATAASRRRSVVKPAPASTQAGPASDARAWRGRGAWARRALPHGGSAGRALRGAQRALFHRRGCEAHPRMR